MTASVTTTGTGKLDLTDNDLVIGTGTQAGVHAQIASGFAGYDFFMFVLLSTITQLGNVDAVNQLSQALEVGIPLFGARHISLTIPGGPTGGPTLRGTGPVNSAC